MANEFEDTDIEILRRTGEPSPIRLIEPKHSLAARLVARLYRSVGAAQRSRALAALLRPLGPLAIVAVASGAFAGELGRGGLGTRDDIGRFTSDQIYELAGFVEQVNPEALRSAAEDLATRSKEVSTFAAAAAVLLMRALGGSGTDSVRD